MLDLPHTHACSRPSVANRPRAAPKGLSRATGERATNTGTRKAGDGAVQGLGKALWQGSRGTGAGRSSSENTSEPLGAKVQSWRTNYFLPNCPFLGFAPHFPAASVQHKRCARRLPARCSFLGAAARRGRTPAGPARADGWTQPGPQLSCDGVRLLRADILPVSKQGLLILRHASFCCCQSPQ